MVQHKHKQCSFSRNRPVKCGMVQHTHKRCSFSRNRSVKCRMVQRKHNRSSFDVMIRCRNHQKYKRRMEQLRVNWDSSQWIGTAVIMTSPLRNLAQTDAVKYYWPKQQQSREVVIRFLSYYFVKLLLIQERFR